MSTISHSLYGFDAIAKKAERAREHTHHTSRGTILVPITLFASLSRWKREPWIEVDRKQSGGEPVIV